MDCGIRALQTYCILGSYELQAYGKVIGKVIKLTCPTETEVFKSEYHPQNIQFWEQVNRRSKEEMGYDDV